LVYILTPNFTGLDLNGAALALKLTARAFDFSFPSEDNKVTTALGTFKPYFTGG